jgi:hypothetical protein
MADSEYLCPSCHAAIPLDDVNVAKDVALCRACGRSTAFSLISGASEVSLEALRDQPRSVKAERGVNNELTIVYRRLSPALLFLVPFTAFWSGMSMCGIYGTQIWNGKFDLAKSLFGIPFLIGTIILVTVILFLLFGKWVITLDRGEGTVFTGVRRLGWTRRFSYNRDTAVSMTYATGVSTNGQRQPGILVRTDGQDFIFGALLATNAKQFIAALIAKEVAETR